MTIKKQITELIYKNSKDINEGVLIDFKTISSLIEQIAAINYTRCCTELKDKKAPSFKAWKQIKLITEHNKLFYLNGKSYYYEELYKVYKEWCLIHF